VSVDLLHPPDVVPEPGWAPIDPFRLEGGAGSFVTGDGRPGEAAPGERLRVRYFLRADDGRLVGKAWFGRGAQGPPGHAHGGAIAAVLDEAMGAAAWVAGHIAVAARLDTSFQRMLPLGTDATVEAWVEREAGRKIWTSGRLLDGSRGSDQQVSRGSDCRQSRHDRQVSRGSDCRQSRHDRQVTGEPFAVASGLFIVLPPERFRPLVEQAAAALGVDPEQLVFKGAKR
jgi:acyl-coenzyme A thioesterase PaaI-like protein